MHICVCMYICVYILHIWLGLKLEHHGICCLIMVFHIEVAISKLWKLYHCRPKISDAPVL